MNETQILYELDLLKRKVRTLEEDNRRMKAEISRINVGSGISFVRR